MLKILLYSPVRGYLRYFKCAHSILQLYLFDISLNDVILALSWGLRKLNTCKEYQLYSIHIVQGNEIIFINLSVPSGFII